MHKLTDHERILPQNNMFKVNNKDMRNICKICSKLTITTINWRQSDVFVVNFEQIKKHCARAFIVNFERFTG